jgi:hypothetical protein
LAKYGTEFPWQTDEVKKKKAETNLAKYGTTVSILNPEIQAKRKKTMLDRYGVEQPTLNESIKKKAALGVKQSYANDPTLSKRQVQSKKEKYGEDFAEPVAKGRATQIANGRWVDPDLRTPWAQYKFRVKYLTSKLYKKHKDLLNPDDLPIGRCDYQIDHIYSIRHGFENGVDPEIIASLPNLRLLWHTENKSKHIRSDQTLEALLEAVKKREASE